MGKAAEFVSNWVAQSPSYRMPTISVVIPAMNEARNLPHVLPRLPEIVTEVILVDGRSKDDTIAVARALRPDIRVIAQKGRGKGDALRAGFEAAHGDIIVMLDADGSMAPEEIPTYVGALLGGADYAKGTRFIQGGGTDDMEFHRYLGNLGLVLAVRLLFGGHYSDLCYGYCAFWSRVLPTLRLKTDGFEIETEMNLRALHSGLKVAEVASFESRRVHGVSNLHAIRDGMRVLKLILREHAEQIGILERPAHIAPVEDEFTPAMALLVQEAEHLAQRRHDFAPTTYFAMVDAVEASFNTLVAMDVNNWEARRQQRLYRQRGHHLWKSLRADAPRTQ